MLAQLALQDLQGLQAQLVLLEQVLQGRLAQHQQFLVPLDQLDLRELALLVQQGLLALGLQVPQVRLVLVLPDHLDPL